MPQSDLIVSVPSLLAEGAPPRARARSPSSFWQLIFAQLLQLINDVVHERETLQHGT